jgi:hypothetical protein
MLYRKPSPVVTLAAGMAFAAYHAGERLQIYTPSPVPVMIAAASSTASLHLGNGLIYSATTFAQVEPPLPVVPPNQKFEQS